MPTGFILGPLTLMIWVLFQPSRYRAYLKQLEPELPPGFNLCQLRRAHWRNRRLRSLLIYILIGQPTLMLAANIPLLFVLHWLIQGMGWRLAVAAIPSTWTGNLQVAWITAFFISVGAVGAALPIGSIGTAALQLGWNLSLPASTLQGVGGGWEQIIGILFQFSVAYATHARLAGWPDGAFVSSRRRAIAGVLGGLLLAAAVIGLVRVVAGHAIGLILGIIGGGVALALLMGRTRTPARSVAIGVAAISLFAALTYSGTFLALQYQDGLSRTAAARQAWAMSCALLPCLLLLLPGVLSERLSGPIAGAVAGSLGGCFGWLVVALANTRPPPPPHTLELGLVYAVAGLLWPIWRIGLLFPLQLLMTQLLLRFQIAQPVSLLSLHPAQWDEEQRLPLWGLEDHLVLLALRDPAGSADLLSRIAATPQRWAAREAQIELDIRKLEDCADLTAMAGVHHALASADAWELRAGESPTVRGSSNLKAAVLRSFGRLSLDLQVSLLQGPYHQRASMALLEERLDALARELLRISTKSAARFLPIANSWRRALSKQRTTLLHEAAASREIENPYVVGLPLSEDQLVFVGRTEVAARLERFLLEPRRPPILLYGQRRMGKTSLLRNLSRLLPAELCPLFIDLQGPASRATNHGSFLYNLAKAMAQEARLRRGVLLPGLSREALAIDPFTVFEDWLDAMIQALPGRMVVLALDEFEQLEEALQSGRLDRGQILGMLRHLVQHRSGFRVLLAGAHTIAEVALWAKYLINVQTVRLGCLSRAEAEALITRPIPNFPLRYEPEALQQMLWLTGGHPYLVQLLCDQVVTLKNQHPPPRRYLAQEPDVATAATSALDQGSFFFADIEHNQVSGTGQGILRALAERGPGASWHPEYTEIAENHLLIQREILDEQGAFAIELVRRWFAR